VLCEFPGVVLEYSCVSENLPAGREKVYGVIKLEKDNTEQPKMKSLDKALKLLECFGSVTPELGITELARILELHKSNVFNIVATFEQHGYLEKNKATGKYRLGLKLLEFSYLINENLGYQRVLYDIMKEVSNELGAITYFAVLRGQKVFYLCSAYPHKKDNHFPYRTIIGETAPLYCTSLGKVMMAFMPSEELEAYLTQSVSFHTFTRYTITEPDRLRQEAALIREKGFSVDNEEHEYGVKCVGVPVLLPESSQVAAFSASGPASAFDGSDLEQKAKALKEASFLMRERLRTLA
jgi:IclR family KDG regulon transcriptional repressor